MNADEEQVAVDRVIDLLAKRFPGVPRDMVAEIVEERHHALTGKPIRDFVPVLVEREAREFLRAEAHGQHA
jgi:hypothetical protein